jgi:3-phosphoinositide dependent protein kinase-1
MHQLRSHPFFASINWETLWTDPAPPLEPGLVKREHPLASRGDHDWEDVGSAWDDLVAGKGHSSDEVGWASDGEGSEFQIAKHTGHGNGLHVEEVGPLGENRRRCLLGTENRHPVQESATITGKSIETVTTGPIDSRTVGPESPSTGSPSSSSEGSPVEKRAVQLESTNHPLPEHSFPEIPAKLSQSQLDKERGRNRTMTPVQGNGYADDADL